MSSASKESSDPPPAKRAKTVLIGIHAIKGSVCRPPPGETRVVPQSEPEPTLIFNTNPVFDFPVFDFDKPRRDALIQTKLQEIQALLNTDTTTAVAPPAVVQRDAAIKTTITTSSSDVSAGKPVSAKKVAHARPLITNQTERLMSAVTQDLIRNKGGSFNMAELAFELMFHKDVGKSYAGTEEMFSRQDQRGTVAFQRLEQLESALTKVEEGAESTTVVGSWAMAKQILSTEMDFEEGDGASVKQQPAATTAVAPPAVVQRDAAIKTKLQEIQALSSKALTTDTLLQIPVTLQQINNLSTEAIALSPPASDTTTAVASSGEPASLSPSGSAEC